MTQVDFCRTSSSFLCIFESALSILTVIIYFILGYFSVKEGSRTLPYVRASYTRRHIIKLGLSILLALTALGYTIMYPILDEDVSLKNEMIWFFSFIIWSLNAFLVRNEYKKLGYTTNYLRLAWIIFLLSQTILLVIGLLNVDDNSTHQFIIIYGLNEGAIIGIIFAGFVFSDDSAAQQYSETYLGLVDDKKKSISIEPVINMTTTTIPTSSKKRSVNPSEDFRPFIQEDVQPGQRRKSSMRNSLSREERKDSYSADRRDNESEANNSRINNSRTLSLAQVARVDSGNITAIGIVGMEELVRFDKKTTVYVVEYYINGKRFVTKRSYSEFEYLNQEIIKTKPEIAIPELPPKKTLNKDEATLNERKESFERYLKFLTENSIGLGYLSEFLVPYNNLPYYGKNTKKDASRLSVPNNSLVSRSARSSKVDSSSLVNGSGASDPKSLERNNILTASLKESIERGFEVGEMRFKVKFHEHYHSDKEDATYYQYIIKDAYQNMEWTIRHRYSDFKTLHEELVKRVDKQDKALIPELPNKGNLGFVFKKDPKLIEYRCEALGVFLEKVLNIGLLEEIPFVQEFIRKRNY